MSKMCELHFLYLIYLLNLYNALESVSHTIYATIINYVMKS